MCPIALPLLSVVYSGPVPTAFGVGCLRRINTVTVTVTEYNAHRDLGSRFGTAVRQLALAFYRSRGLAAYFSAIVHAELRALACGACSHMSGSCFHFTLLCMCAMSENVRMANAYKTNEMCTCDGFVSSPGIRCGY